MRIKDIIPVALGREPADLVIRNARILNVFSGEVERGDIAVFRKRIAGIGDYPEGRECMDLGGAFVVPGLIDAHLHIESSMLTPREFARAILPHGTTTVVADPHEIANVMGLDGVDYILRSTEGVPLNVYMAMPSAVPATSLETSGARLGVEDMIGFLEKHPRVLALGEVMNYPGVLAADPELLAKIELLRHRYKKIDGHAPGLSGKRLNAYIAAFIRSDHESVSVAEAREKPARGMQVFLREGTAARNLDALLPLVDELNHPFLSFCTDDRSPGEIFEEGHIDGMVRTAVRRGVHPAIAVRMATINTARHFNLRSMGAIAPGYKADILVLDDLESFDVRTVIKDGRVVARDGIMTAELEFGSNEAPGAPRPSKPMGPMNPPKLVRDDLRIPARPGRVRVMGVSHGDLCTRHGTEVPALRDGEAVADPSRDILKLLVAERYRGLGFSLGFVQGMRLREGAVATSVGHDSHNISACGADDRDILAAVGAVRDMHGGLAVVVGGEVRASLPLPIAGLISDRPLAEVRLAQQAVEDALESVGARRDLFMSLSFVQLPVIPHLKQTDRGLVDVERQEIVPLWV